MTSNIIDPAIEKMIDQINKKGFKGKISPGLVLNLPKDVMEPLVVEGKTDKEIADIHDVSASSVFYLRKFYELPGAREVKKMLACVDPKSAAPNDEIKTSIVTHEIRGYGLQFDSVEPVFGKKEEAPMTINEARVREGLAPLKEMTLMHTSNPPLLDIENQAIIITPLLQGIAKYLERLGKEKVQVVVTVRKV